MGKSIAYFMKWAKFLPIPRNGQFCGLGVTYIHFNSVFLCDTENTACVGDVCGLNGICVPDQDTENKYTCVCRKGYTGTDCSVPPSPCLDHACQNDATCIPDGTDDYTCTCQEGYTGSYCEHKIGN